MGVAVGLEGGEVDHLGDLHELEAQDSGFRLIHSHQLVLYSNILYKTIYSFDLSQTICGWYSSYEKSG